MLPRKKRSFCITSYFYSVLIPSIEPRFWEDFGREAVRILDERPASLRTFGSNRSRDDELSELFLQPWNAPYRYLFAGMSLVRYQIV